MSYRTNQPFLQNPTGVIKGEIRQSSDASKVNWVEAAGTLSIQPDGTIQHRNPPQDTDGPYERATLADGRLVYDVGTPVIFDVTLA